MKQHDFQDIVYSIYAVFVAGVTFWIYMKTLAPTVSFFDSGELISAAYTLGVAHPPGYPLYVLIGWLFSHLPFGTVAWRINLMSACFATLAAIMVYVLTYRILTWKRGVEPDAPAETEPETPSASVRPDPERMLPPVIAMAAALSFAFGITHWKQAVIAEVYTLNAFLAGVILLLLVRWRQHYAATGDSAVWRLYLLALLFGVGFGNHQTLALLALAAGFLVLLTVPRLLLDARFLLKIVLFGVLGLSIYLLIPLRAMQDPAINWGNASTLEQFTWLVTREGYSTVERGNALQTLWNDLFADDTAPDVPADEADQPMSAYETLTHSLFWKQLRTFNPVREFGYLGTGFAIVGLLYGLIVYRQVGATLLIAVLSWVLITVIISDPPEENIFLVEEFHTPAYLIVAVWVGMGVMAIGRAILWIASFSRTFQYVLVFLMALYVLIPPASLLLRNLRTVDRHQNYVAYDYAQNVLDSLQPDAILFTWGDSGAFPLWYLQIVEGQRPDVTLVHTPHLSAKWYVDELPQDLFLSSDPYQRCKKDLSCFISEIGQKNVHTRPIYFDFSSAHSIVIPYPMIPYGVTYKLARPGERLTEDVWDRYRFRGILDDTRIAVDPDVKRTFLIYGSAYVELGYYYLEYDQLEKATEAFNAAVRFAPELGDRIVRDLSFQNRLMDARPKGPLGPRRNLTSLFHRHVP
ncbi:DUF2723 domain-containing protein [candidate division KSB3 bacterium]|uniref:DUF2723 domain-containing protein n=1 Tax=candidate division KSB3 bacterium TaxID=2044937 RepID=A0A9D5JSV0_9BACT|nr:DUF2723 domain-containing protein [candidate division KSB3 bacterium]MBD3323419.1 DUF2723 domain-containing protein [candidate division KSB3 bacterium]